MISNFDPLCTLDIGTISNFFIDIDNDIVRDIQTSNVKPLMSYPISVQCRDIQISYFFVRYQSFGRYRIRYVIPGAAGRTGHVPAPPTGPASWSSTRLDGLYSCVTVLTPFPAGDQQLLSVAAVARPWCGLPAGHGGQS